MGCGACSGSSSTQNSTGVKQSSTDKPVQSLAQAKRPPLSNSRKPTKLLPNVEYVENVIVVWLDSGIGNDTITQNYKDQLQQHVVAVKTFTTPESCHTFINGIKNEKIFLIVSNTLGKQFVPTIHKLTQMDSVYVFSSDAETSDDWTSTFPAVHGHYKSIDGLCKQLNVDVKKCEHDLVGFKVLKVPSSQTVKKPNQQDVLFMYDQLFKEIILNMNDEEMSDMYEFCEMHYCVNPTEMKFLNELKTSYSKRSPIWWYSREGFLYKMLNKALRTREYPTLYTFHVFIRHLHQKLIEQQKQTPSKDMKLYRGQGMEIAEFDDMRANEGGLISISNFLSTSTNIKVGLEFAKNNFNDPKKVAVLMEITIYKNISITVADVSKISFYGGEDEWLFSMGTIFRIGSIKQRSDGVWHINLILTNDINQQLMALKNYFKKSIEDTNACLSLGKLMCQLANWESADFFYQKCLETEDNVWYRRAVILNDLGSVKAELKDYAEALRYFEESLALKQKHGGSKHKGLASTYNNIATIYYKQEKMDQAIEYFQKAIDAYNVTRNHNQQFVVTLYNNLANVLNDQGNHEEALKANEKCLNIQINMLPAIHPDLASTYCNISNTFHQLGCLEQAREYTEKAVNVDFQGLPFEHPQTQLHMQNLNIITQELGNAPH